ncbi:Asp-tRNA(Asn)/Glu-tRNA(Gln) amidotransferase subunit GatA [Sporosarcina sp. G11-34]|uniref:Asp-tRNA(Asn)/Glu-tRNA(Gln) amidotransferase subunit GatA n=1 Tax=Sporosarcina sp. G11-34 TaxID=2849605 RepID=UPI0022A9D541|nr:Asp-tRNA(Asn)/Glu-tRNA(Gln) amidotransferase subunit GatA [Sporosarcina sp. G11-34]MCZ2260192.1 Asp-tRNA(Asn)/Glu-tRNA(Gln) amidotransferase subunit GatA [Sporosarcina sp. G11-34]
MTLFNKTAKELQTLLHNREVSVKELTEESFTRVSKIDGEVQAFLALNEEAAIAKAEKLDEQPMDNRGPLFGLPIGLKDNIVTKGLVTTCASRMLENFTPVYNATVVDKLNDAGMVNIGKLNMDEFAMGSSTESSIFKTTRNPWNLDHVPGGSSGGSAAAVAAGEVPFALGSDTGGSVRQPASYCGVVGMKPTYGRVSRSGLVAFASSLDQIGPLTRTVEDNALLLNAIAGLDAKDSLSSALDVPDFSSALTGDIRGMKIGVPKEYMGEGISEDVKNAVMDALKVLESLGAEWEEVSLPHSKYALPAYYLISSAEASSNFARFDGVHYGFRTEHAQDLEELYKKSRAEGFGDEVKRRILLGTYTLSAGHHETYFEKSQQARTLITQDFKNVFAKYDVIIGPTTPVPAFKIGEVIKDPLTVYTNDVLTVPINLAGVPALSVPCGFSNGLPLGLQIIGNHFDEATIYKVAHAYEKATDFHTRTPAIWEGK